jgi:hemerythrin superfamily protein
MAQIYDVIKQEHAQIRELLAKTAAGRCDGKLFGQLFVMLQAHQKAEEKVVYPSLMAPPATRERTLEGIEEHHVGELILKEMQKVDPKDDRFKAKLGVLRENVEMLR